MNQKLNRRHFIKNSAALVGGLIVASPFATALAKIQKAKAQTYPPGGTSADEGYFQGGYGAMTGGYYQGGYSGYYQSGYYMGGYYQGGYY